MHYEPEHVTDAYRGSLLLSCLGRILVGVLIINLIICLCIFL